MTDHFRVSGDNQNARLVRRRAHVLQDALQFLYGKSLFQNQRKGKILRLRPGHRQVIDRPADRYAPDTAAGEKSRCDDIAVRSERDFPAHI